MDIEWAADAEWISKRERAMVCRGAVDQGRRAGGGGVRRAEATSPSARGPAPREGWTPRVRTGSAGSVDVCVSPVYEAAGSGAWNAPTDPSSIVSVFGVG